MAFDDMEDEESQEDQMIPQKRKTNWQKILEPFNLVIIVLVIAWILFHGRYGSVSYDKVTFYVFGGIMGMFFLRFSYAALENISPKILWNRGHSTTTGRFEEVGNFYIFRLGGIRQLDIEGRKGTLIAPSTSVTKNGDSINVAVRAWIADMGAMPIEIRDFLLQHPWYKPPYLIGYASEEQFTEEIPKEYVKDEDFKQLFEGRRTPNIGSLVIEFTEKNRSYNQLVEILRGHYGSMEKALSAMTRMRAKVTSRSGSFVDKYVLGKRDEE